MMQDAVHRCVSRTSTLWSGWKLFVIFSCMLYLTSPTTVQSVCQTANIRQDVFTTDFYRQCRSTGEYHCAAECLKATSCEAFSFSSRRKMCTLNKHNTTSGHTISAPGYVTSDIRLWSKSLAGPCQYKQCENVSRCVVQRNLTVQCIPDCGMAPSIEYIQLLDENADPHVSYICTEGYGDPASCKRTPTTMMCQSDGNWDISRVQCIQTTWDNLQTSYFKEDFPCPVIANFSLTIHGIIHEGALIEFHDKKTEVFIMKYTGSVLEITLVEMTTQVSADMVTPDMPFTLVFEQKNGHFTITIDSIRVHMQPLSTYPDPLVSLQLAHFEINSVRFNYY